LLSFIGCGGSGGGSSSGPANNPPPGPPPTLKAADVDKIIKAAVTSVNVPVEVAVTDRLGNVLGIYASDHAPTTGLGNFGGHPDSANLAVALARTGAYFSNDQAPLSSRTVRYISGIHFPPGVAGTGNAALYGIENTNRGCAFNTTYLPGKNIPPSTLLDGTTPGLGIITGKADLQDIMFPFAVNPGGVPVFESGTLVGGIGVVADNLDAAEYAAFAGSVASPFGPTPAPPGVVTINGVALPFVNNQTPPPGITPGPLTGSYVSGFGPKDSPGSPPDGYLVGPTGSTYPGGLTKDEVDAVVTSAFNTASHTRAQIRLPIGQRTRMMISVADLDGNLLAIYRMPDATIFSIDVSVAKARNVIYFSSKAGELPGAYGDSQPGSVDLPGVPEGTAVTNRTISFGAQALFPPGIDDSGPGPFYDLYLTDTANPCTQGSQPVNPNQNGIVFFPGALPLYRNGVLVGGLGVSGDGVDQDDFVTAGGAAMMTLNDASDPADSTHGFEAPSQIRADQIVIDNVRLPYIKFPRNPTQ
jgi:uncharacterized protein GlcG (DUF336 family)